VQITGKVTNLKGTAGTPVRLKFIILNRQGAELTTEEISVSLPATEESERFNARVKVPEGAAAWKYTVVGS
jgi:hypothetical protein